MTVINDAAQIAREHARTDSGQFGIQQHTEPELGLSDYTFPALVRGLAPDEVDLNIWFDPESESWRVCAYPVHQQDGQTDTSDDLFPPFAVRLREDRVEDFGEDHWTALDTAPLWLRDLVTPSLAEDEYEFPGTRRANAAWLKARHERILADGGYASAYDNAYIADFERQFPSNTPEDAADALLMMEVPDEDTDEAERELAAAELSRRATRGVGGVLTDLRALRPGDQVSLAHLAGHYPSPESSRYTTELVVVRGFDRTGSEGVVQVALDDGRYLTLPIGARVPATGVTYQGQDFTDKTQLVQHLVRTGALHYRAAHLDVDEALAKHNASFFEGHPDFITTATPSLDGARL